MKQLLLFLLLLLPFASNGQAGYINLNDFPTPYPRSVFWLRGSVPAGTNPIFTISGLNSFKFHTDSVVVDKLAIREDGSPYKLVSITNDGMLNAFTPTYLTSQVNSDWNSVSGASQILNKPAIPAAQVQSDWTQAGSGAVDFIKNKPTIPAAQVSSDWNSVASPTQILNKPSIPLYYHNAILAAGMKTETFAATVTSAGNAIVYLTDNGLVSGNALYTNVNYVLPLVNDSNVNYTYGYTVSGDKKTLTVNVKSTPAISIALLSLTLLGVPANAANGTALTILVVGN